MARWSLFLLPVAIALLWTISQPTPANDLQELDKKRVVVCGASRGIGVELARSYAKRGSELLLVARNKQKLEELAAELRATYNVQVYVQAISLSEEAAADSLIKAIQEELKWDHIDVLCLNHVVAVYGHFFRKFDMKGTDMSDLTKAFQINALSYMFLATKALPLLLAAPSAGKPSNSGGSQPSKSQVVVVSSLAGKMGVPFTTGYAGVYHT